MAEPGISSAFTLVIDRLSVPAVEARDLIGLRDRVPAPDVRELAPMGLAGADMTVIEIASQRLHRFAEKPITVSSRSKPVLG